MQETKIIISADAGQAQQSFKSLSGSMDGVSGKLMELSSLAGTLAGALSLTAFATAIKGSIDLADNLNDLAKKTGASVETLAGLQLAAAQSGTSLEAIANGSKRLATTMVENRAVFEQMGISTNDQTEALIQLGDVFAGMQDPVERSALAVKVFGKAGVDMLPMLMEGSDAIRAMIERGQELSPVTTEMARQADIFNDSLAEFELQMRGVTVSMAAGLLPKLNETIAAFNDLNKSGASTLDMGKGISTVFETIVVLGANVGYVFKQTGNEIGGMVAQLQALATGDFEGFKRIGAMMKEDAAQARKDIDAFSERVMNAGQAPAAAAAPGAAPDSRGSTALAALSPQTVSENDKLRQQDIAGWVKYADAVLAEGERVDELLRKQIEDQNAAEEKKIAATVDAFNRENETLAELVAMQDITEAERIQFKLDAENTRLEQQRQTLMASNAWTLEMEQKFNAARLNAQAQADSSMLKLDRTTAINRQQVLVASLSTISSLMSNNNVALFRIGQAASIANATISTIEGATNALRLGPFLGPPLAAAIYAAGAANIAQIASTKIGGGTPSPVNATFSGGSVAGGTDPSPITAPNSLPNASVASPRQQFSFTFVGDQAISYDQMVNQFIPRLNEALGNGVDITVNRA